MHLGDRQDVPAEDSSMLYSACEIQMPCLRKLVLCFHIKRCSWFCLSCGIISEQDSSAAHWGRSHLLFSQLVARKAISPPG